MKPRKPMSPFKIGKCTECGLANKKLIAKRCFEQPNFCYQNHQKNRYDEKKKASHEQNKVKKHTHVTLPVLLDLATKLFNKWIRERDLINGQYFICISCNQALPKAEIQAGHYIPSTCSALRFNEFNTNAECVQCNCHDPNHLEGYRKNLINKIGLKKVEWLEGHSISSNFKWQREEIEQLITKYKTR